MAARRWLLVAVLFALACAQALGFMHRVAHPPAGAGITIEHAIAIHADAHQAGWLEALFAHTDEHGCRLFDGVGQCGAPSQAVPGTPPLPAALVLLPFLAAAFVERAPAAFNARAPPASR